MPGKLPRPTGTAALVLALAASCSAAHAEVTVRDPGQYVVDQAEIIDAATQQRLEGWLRELEQKSTAQVKVLTVQSTQGEDFFGFAQRHFDLWQLGQKGKDNGALIVLALRERQVRIHTGYGLEGALPDSWSGSLSREVAAQYFKRGQYAQGLYRMTVAVVNKVADEYNVTVTGVPAVRHRPPGPGGASPWTLVCCLIPVFLLLPLFFRMGQHRRHRRRWGGGIGEAILWGSILRELSRGGRSSWGGGSRGGFGGGFGGFGGGFGGSFGGGGRSGGGGGGASW
jgi:uncharacterized protein